MYMRFRDFCDPEWQVERRVSVPLLPPDKSKYFPSLIKPPCHIRYKAIVRWASAKKHSLSSQSHYTTTKLYEFSLLEAATKPNLSSFSAGLAAALHTQTSLELGRRPGAWGDQTTAWAWLVTDTQQLPGLWSEWGVRWGDWPGLHLTTSHLP